MTDTPSSPNLVARLLLGFLAGFLATLVFHQLTLSLLWAIKLAPFAPFAMAATKPFGVPAVFSLAFFGGLWGILFVLIDRRFPAGYGYWLLSFLFGAIFPSLVALLVVLPLKGKPMGGGWHPPLLITAFLINGAWGLGTALLVKLFSRRLGQARTPGKQSGIQAVR
ncbi:MAG: hypothetical protein AB1461_03015 [Thermodesulfobacteriota bacterium]